MELISIFFSSSSSFLPHISLGLGPWKDWNLFLPVILADLLCGVEWELGKERIRGLEVFTVLVSADLLLPH